MPEVGLRWCGAYAARTEGIPMSKDRRKPTTRKHQAHNRTTVARQVQQRSSLKSSTRRQQTSQAERAGSKQTQVIALLRSPVGATIDAMTKATGWQHHSVRGFLSGIVRKKLALNLVSEAGEGGRVYRISDRKKSVALQA